MGRFCRGFLQCLLKLLNFLLILVGIFMIVYSLWMLNEWNSQNSSPAEPPAAPPVGSRLGNAGRSARMVQQALPALARNLPPLPAPWFIYAFFGAGVIVLLVTCTGHIAAETASGCCLCCYVLLLVVLMLAQAGLAGVFVFDKNWHKEVPEDPTGEFDKLEKFIERNINICQWVALGVVVIEVLSLFLAVLLRTTIIGSNTGYDSDEEYVPTRLRQPLLSRQATQQNPTPAAPSESRPPRNDAWSTRMREKYGLDTSEFTYNPSDSKRVQQQAPAPAEAKRGCVIM